MKRQDFCVKNTKTILNEINTLYRSATIVIIRRYMFNDELLFNFEEYSDKSNINCSNHNNIGNHETREK